MKKFSNSSTSGLLLSCQMYLAVKSDLNDAHKNLKISFGIFIISFSIIATNIFSIFPGTDLMKSEILSGIIFLSFIGGLFISIWNYKEFILKKKVEAIHKERIYSDYSIYMVENDKVWFDIGGQIVSLNADKIDDTFVKELLILGG